MVGPSRPTSPISRKMLTSIFSWRKASSTRGASLSRQYAAAAPWMARSVVGQLLAEKERVIPLKSGVGHVRVSRSNKNEGKRI